MKGIPQRNSKARKALRVGRTERRILWLSAGMLLKEWGQDQKKLRTCCSMRPRGNLQEKGGMAFLIWKAASNSSLLRWPPPQDPRSPLDKLKNSRIFISKVFLDLRNKICELGGPLWRALSYVSALLSPHLFYALLKPLPYWSYRPINKKAVFIVPAPKAFPFPLDGSCPGFSGIDKEIFPKTFYW